MATANTIEARLRIAADLAQAITALRELRKEIVETTRSADSVGTAVAAKTAAAPKADRTEATRDETEAARAATRAAAEQAQAEQAATQAARAAAREKADEARRAAKETAEAAAAAKRATSEQTQAELEAARAARAAARQKFEEERQARRRENDEKRKQAAADAADEKKRRGETAKAAQLAPQLTDIAVGLASGQSPFLVAIQQGGQLKDIYGGVGNALQALGRVVTPVRLAVGGLALAFALAAKAALDGRRETDLLNKTIALTGNAAATSIGQLDVLAKRVSAQQQVAVGDVRENLQGLVATGQFVGATMDSAARATSVFRKVTGASAEEAIKQFDGMGESVSAWAAKQNRAYNFLTTEQVKHIRTLESEGRAQEAMRFALDEFTKTLESRVVPNLGTLERAWLAVGRAVSGFVDQLKAIGRETTAEERIAKLTAKIEELKAARESRGGRRRSTFDAQIAATEAELEIERREVARRTLRTLDTSAEQQETQRKTKEQTVAFQSELAQLDLAGARKRAQIRLNELDARQSAAESANARGLVSARAHAQALNQIEQQRIQVQLGLLERQRELVEGKLAPGVTSTPEEKRAVQAELLQVEQQLLAAKSQLRAKAAEGRSVVAASVLDEAREGAAKWAAAWQQAAEQVRQFAAANAQARAVSIASPDARSKAEAEATASVMREQLQQQRKALEQALGSAPSPEAKQLLQQQLEALGRESGEAIERGMRETRFSSLQAQLAEQLEAVQLRESEIDAQVQRGALTTQEAERKKIAVRAESIEQLDKILALLAEIAQSPADRNAVEAARQRIGALKNTMTELEATARSSALQSFSTFFTDVVTGAQKADKAFGNMVKNIAKSMLDVIARRLGEQLLKSLFPPTDGPTTGIGGANGGGSGGASGGGWWQLFAQIVASFFHQGGVIGAGRVSGMSRALSPAIWRGAQVLHSGGLVGLRPNERPVIAEVGEEMLTADDPRHRNNFRGGPAIGNLNISVTIDGTGNDGEDQTTGQALARGLHQTVRSYIAEEMRPGGMLADRGRS